MTPKNPIVGLFLAFAAAAVPAGAALAYSGEQFVVCNLNPDGDNFLALRTCAGTHCPIVKKLAPDTFLLTTDPEAENGWRDVIVLKSLQDQSVSGPTGYVFSKYICKIRY